MPDRRIRTIPGYGGSLRKQLAALGWTQTQLANEIGVSRLTIGRAVNRDEVSERTEERIATALAMVPKAAAPPSEEARSRGRTARTGRLMGGGMLCNATDLEAWASRRDAQGILPLVIRRLVLATGRRVAKAEFRTEEGVALSGWDGIVEARDESTFVPEGVSGWEMGTGRGWRRAAEKYVKDRADEPAPLTPIKTTFVYVTLRRAHDKDAWEQAQTDGGAWRRVRLLDADSLAAWLEQAPAVHLWLSTLIGKMPPNVVGLDRYWETWAEATRPALTRRIILAGRDEGAHEICAHLANSSEALCIGAESKGEAIAALYCAISDLPLDERDRALARAVVVESPEAMRHLTASDSPLLLIPTFEAHDLAASAARAGHIVVLPFATTDPSAERRAPNVVSLPRLHRQTVLNELRELGLPTRSAVELAGLARRSLTAFRRKTAHVPTLRRPDWVRPSACRSLVPALLAGSWHETNVKDREILATLGQRPYEEVRDALLRWRDRSDPPVMRTSDGWYLVSPEDAWHQLSGFITSDDLKRFGSVASTVLGVVDPAIDLPANQRLVAKAMDQTVEPSALLRRGLATTLSIMGSSGDSVPSAALPARTTAQKVVRQLLACANQDWRLWASLSRRLPMLAEAAPDAFLESVEEGLVGSSPVLAHLFTGDEGPMFSSPAHVGLLWALETLAWSRDHVGRVVPLLAQLDGLDPASELRPKEHRRSGITNRPLASLKGIFRRWLPQTSATLNERLQLLDHLRESYGEVAWAVMVSMLPEFRGVAVPHPEPKVRRWSESAGDTVSYLDNVRTTNEVINRLLRAATSNGVRWTSLLERLPVLPPEPYDAVIETLERLASTVIDDDDRNKIWATLRDLVGRHRAFSSAEWAMKPERVSRLERVLGLFVPRDLVAQYAWLFDYSPRPQDGGNVSDESFGALQTNLHQRRIEAVEVVASKENFNGLKNLARAVKVPIYVGRAAAHADAPSRFSDRLLSRHLADEQPALSDLTQGYVEGRANRSSAWIEEQLRRPELSLSPEQEAVLLTTLRTAPPTWRMAAQCGPPTAIAYWRRLPAHFVPADHVIEAVPELVAVGRPFAAVELLGAYIDEHTAPADLIARVLDAAASDTCAHDAPSQLFAYLAATLLDSLVDASADKATIGHLEWRLLPIIDHHIRPPKALGRLFRDDPDFFAEVLALAYAPDDESPAEDVQQTDPRLATNAFTVLQSWDTIPGHRTDESVDPAGFRNWIDSALTAIAQRGRLRAGTTVIGQMLSASPTDRDGTWPCFPVRSLIEDLKDKRLESGFFMGVRNRRGVVTKGLHEGGTQERGLADRYDGHAAAVRMTHPRTARLLRAIADSYRYDARLEDADAEISEDLET